MSAVCPVCGKDDAIQKVSSVVSSGQSSGTFSGPTGGVVHVGGKWGTVGGYTSLSGRSTTEVAQLLTPPAAPKQYTTKSYNTFGILISMFCLVISGWLFLAQISLGFGAETSRGDPPWLWVPAFLLLLGGVRALLEVRNR